MEIRIFAMSGLESCVDMLGQSRLSQTCGLHGHLQNALLSADAEVFLCSMRKERA